MDTKKILVLIITVLRMLVLLLFCKLLDGRAVTIPTEEPPCHYAARHSPCNQSRPSSGNTGNNEFSITLLG